MNQYEHRVWQDGSAVLAALAAGPATVRSLAERAGLSEARVRVAIAYLLGARRAKSCGRDASGLAELWSAAEDDGDEFDHVYAAIEDSVETLGEVWTEAPGRLRYRLECCMVWLGAALRRIDGEPPDEA